MDEFVICDKCKSIRSHLCCYGAPDDIRLDSYNRSNGRAVTIDGGLVAENRPIAAADGDNSVVGIEHYHVRLGDVVVGSGISG